MKMTHMNSRSHPLAPRSAGVVLTIIAIGMRTPAKRGANGRNRRRGFSFAEVMFAVVILGIGFILIAAIFPVAIQQSQATGEESNAAALAKQAAAVVQSASSSTVTTMTVYGGTTTLSSGKGYIANSTYNPANPGGASASYQTVSAYPIFPPTVKNYVLGTGGFSSQTIPSNFVVGGSASVVPVAAAPPAVVAAVVGTRWDLLKASAILPNDPRFAYSLFYKRENGSANAELIVVGVTARNQTAYNPASDGFPTMFSPSASPVSTTAGIFPTATTNTTICPDTITISTAALQREGWYVQTPSTASPTVPQLRTYTLGVSINGSNTNFEMWPGDTMSLTAGTSGLWGTTGRITDFPLASQSVALGGPAMLQPTVAYANFKTDPDAPGGRIILSTQGFNSANGPSANPSFGLPTAAVPGAFVIVADDCPNPGTTTYTLPANVPGFFAVGALNGRIFRLGKAITEDAAENNWQPPQGTVAFDIDPEYGMRPPGTATGGPNFSPDALPNPLNPNLPVGQPGVQAAKVYIIGAGTDPTTGAVGGKAQDIGVFATYFQVQ
jgi:type II secretory pathway pseudopilin PulG